MVKKAKPPWIVTSRDQVAEFFRVTDRTIATWITLGMPRTEPKPRRFQYDLKAILLWRDEQEEERKRQEAESDDDPRMRALKLAKLEQEVRIKTVEADEREDLVVPRDEAHECMQRFAHRMRLLGELYKRTNPPALGPLNAALEDCERILTPVTDDSSGETDIFDPPPEEDGSP